MIKIVLDVMSGEYGYKPAMIAAQKFAQKYPHVELFLVGSQAIFNNYHDLAPNIKTIFANDVIAMNDESFLAYKKKPNSSMTKALDVLIKNNYSAMISAANTSAYITAAFLVSKPICKNLRPPLALQFSTLNGKKILLDVGAIVDCSAANLETFALLGSCYEKVLFNNPSPKVALLQNGTEKHKGNIISRKAYELLKANKKINFIGNIEARDVFDNQANVIVLDGFVGNQVLKTMEGSFKFANISFAKHIPQKFISKLDDQTKQAFAKFHHDLTFAEKYGGAIVLGLNHVIIKVHGNSQVKEYYSSLELSYKIACKKLIDQLKNELLPC